jgi:uncharacterized protein YndB with AHSA1/START domain
MTLTIKPAPVRRSVTVHVLPERAFEAFTNDIGRWWPGTHKIGAAAFRTAVLEPRVGGRWFEVGEDGTECQWGDVLVWEPPSRLVLAWRIRSDWQFDPALLTEVEVKFVPVGDGATRVELEHRLIENMGEGAEQTRAVFDSDQGWPGILERYRAAA